MLSLPAGAKCRSTIQNFPIYMLGHCGHYLDNSNERTNKSSIDQQLFLLRIKFQARTIPCWIPALLAQLKQEIHLNGRHFQCFIRYAEAAYTKTLQVYASISFNLEILVLFLQTMVESGVNWLSGFSFTFIFCWSHKYQQDISSSQQCHLLKLNNKSHTV